MITSSDYRHAKNLLELRSKNPILEELVKTPVDGGLPGDYYSKTKIRVTDYRTIYNYYLDHPDGQQEYIAFKEYEANTAD